MEERDEIGGPLWPAQLRLNLRSNDQLFPHALATAGTLQPWYAPECPECKVIWPGFIEEDDIPETIYCPHCHTSTPTELVDIYLVIGIVKPQGS